MRMLVVSTPAALRHSWVVALCSCGAIVLHLQLLTMLGPLLTLAAAAAPLALRLACSPWPGTFALSLTSMLSACTTYSSAVVWRLKLETLAAPCSAQQQFLLYLSRQRSMCVCVHMLALQFDQALCLNAGIACRMGAVHPQALAFQAPPPAPTHDFNSFSFGMQHAGGWLPCPGFNPLAQMQFFQGLQPSQDGCNTALMVDRTATV